MVRQVVAKVVMTATMNPAILKHCLSFNISEKTIRPVVWITSTRSFA